MENEDQKHPGGRPTKYNPEMIGKIEEYLKKCDEDNELPMIEDVALLLDINDDTVVSWENAVYPEDYEDESMRGQLKFPEFSATIKRVKMKQKKKLMKDGLYGGKEVNSTMAIFLLKANHNMVETMFADITSKGEKIGHTSTELLDFYRQVMKKEDGNPDTTNSN